MSYSEHSDVAKFFALRDAAIADARGKQSPTFIFRNRRYFCEYEPIHAGQEVWGTKLVGRWGALVDC